MSCSPPWDRWLRSHQQREMVVPCHNFGKPAKARKLIFFSGTTVCTLLKAILSASQNGGCSSWAYQLAICCGQNNCEDSSSTEGHAQLDNVSADGAEDTCSTLSTRLHSAAATPVPSLQHVPACLHGRRGKRR